MARRVVQSLSRLGVIESLLYLVSLAYGLYVMFYARTLFETRERYAIIFLALSLLICILQSTKGKQFFPLRKKWNTFAVITVASLVVFTGVYFYAEYWDLITLRAGANTLPDLILATLLVYLVMHITWKTSGKAIPLLVLAFYIYGIVGPWLPGALVHYGLNFGRIIRLSALDMDGIFGSFNQVAATWVAIFVVYAGLIQGFGGLEYIVNITGKVTERFKYGLPQVAVIGSLVFGSFNGSAGANAAGTGSITIPTMKRRGLSGDSAAAIEAVASSGGQLMPPVMGAAAFVMCDYLEVPYVRIISAGFPPALLFYGAVALGVYLLSRRSLKPPLVTNLGEESKHFTMTYYLQGLPIIISIISLLVVLIHFRLDPLSAGFYFIISFLVTRLLYDLATSKIRLSIGARFITNIIKGMRIGAVIMAPLAALIACMGIVVGVLVSTGLAQKISWMMVDLAGGSLVILLLLIMLVSILFGLAVSTFVCYILVVMLAAPALATFGIEPLPAHFTVFYLGLISGVTPPVAIAAAVAAGIAGAPFFKVCWASMRLAVAMFILPFVFVTRPALLAGDATAIVTMLIVMIPLFALVIAIQVGGRDRRIIMTRIVLGALGAVGLFASQNISYVAIGLIALLGIAGAVYWKRKVTGGASSTYVR